MSNKIESLLFAAVVVNHLPLAAALAANPLLPATAVAVILLAIRGLLALAAPLAIAALLPILNTAGRVIAALIFFFLPAILLSVPPPQILLLALLPIRQLQAP